MKASKQRIIYLILIILAMPFVHAAGQSQEFTAGEPQVVADGFQFTEGPLWHPDGYLLFSDIPASTIYKWTPDSTDAHVYLTPSGHSNGLVLDKQGRLILCQHDGKVSVVENDTTFKILASSFQGKRLNSPNDAVVKSDGTIYFTDPPYGVNEDERELDFSGVYRISPDGQLDLLYDQFPYPNGIALSPKENKLYVNNTSGGQIIVFDITSDGSVSLPHNFAHVGEADSTGGADGMAMDKQGNLYSTGPGGVYVFDGSGMQVGKVDIPAQSTNVTLGREEQELFVTTPSAIYRVPIKNPGQ